MILTKVFMITSYSKHVNPIYNNSHINYFIKNLKQGEDSIAIENLPRMAIVQDALKNSNTFGNTFAQPVNVKVEKLNDLVYKLQGAQRDEVKNTTIRMLLTAALIAVSASLVLIVAAEVTSLIIFWPTISVWIPEFVLGVLSTLSAFFASLPAPNPNPIPTDPGAEAIIALIFLALIIIVPITIALLVIAAPFVLAAIPPILLPISLVALGYLNLVKSDNDLSPYRIEYLNEKLTDSEKDLEAYVSDMINLFGDKERLKNLKEDSCIKGLRSDLYLKALNEINAAEKVYGFYQEISLGDRIYSFKDKPTTVDIPNFKFE